MNETNQLPGGEAAHPERGSPGGAAPRMHWPLRRPRRRRTGTATCAPWRSSTISASAREREIDNARKFAIERFAQELVTVGDALEAGIRAGAANPGPALLEGAQATLRS